MGIRKIKTTEGQLIEDFKQGDDVHKALADLYEHKRVYPYGRPHDYPSAKAVPYPRPSRPTRQDEFASYVPDRNSPVSPAPDESAVQFRNDKVADHVDVPVSDWTRGGDCSHPHFDHGKSGDRYRK
jgi:hypothetical protein